MLHILQKLILEGSPILLICIYFSYVLVTLAMLAMTDEIKTKEQFWDRVTLRIIYKKYKSLK